MESDKPLKMKDYDVSLVRSAWDQPQGLLDLVGMSFRLWRRNAGFIVRALIAPSIFLMIGTTGFNCLLSYSKSFSGDIPKAVLLGVVSFILYVFGQVWMHVRTMALLRLTNGFAPDWKSALTFAHSRWLWLIGEFVITLAMSIFLCGFWFVIMAIAVGVTKAGSPGQVMSAVVIIGSMLGLGLTVCFLILFWYVMVCVLACEDTNFFGVVGRTFQVMFQNFGRVVGFGLIIYMVLNAAAIPVTLPVVIASAADAAFRQMAGGGYDYTPSLWVVIFSQFWEAVTQLVLRPVGFFAFGLLYLDLRHRADGLDIRRRLRVLKEQLLSTS